MAATLGHLIPQEVMGRMGRMDELQELQRFPSVEYGSSQESERKKSKTMEFDISTLYIYIDIYIPGA